MIKQFSQGDKISYDISTWVVDALVELQQLKKPIGHKAIVIETGDVYMSSSNGTWHCIANSTDDLIDSASTVWEPIL